MAGKGSPKGVRQGGRKKGSPNKKMTPRDARTIAAAEALNRDIQERSPQPGTEAAEKIMGKFAHNCAAMAVRLMPSQDPNGDLVFRHDEHKTWWKFMMELTFKYANGAAPYQSPTFRAVAVMDARSGHPPIDVTADNVELLDDDNGAMRVYRRLVAGPKAA